MEEEEEEETQAMRQRRRGIRTRMEQEALLPLD